MIPSISAQLPIEDQTAKVGYRLTTLYDQIYELNKLFFEDCSSSKDITDQIPLWIVTEKKDLQDSGENPITIFDLLQKYYDWLYCDTDSGSQFNLGQKLLDLINIDKTRDDYIQRFAYIYANGLEPESFVPNGGKIDLESARHFIKNIRKNFYQKKTTIDGIRYFFKILFNIPEDDIRIEYPKKYLLRLNGGRFYNENFTFPGETGSYEVLQTLSGSCLNFSRMQDSNFYQDYSYLLKVGIKSSYYKDTYKKLAHPAGLKVIYERSLEDYTGPQTDYDYFQVCERTYLRNYSAYGFSYEYTDIIGSCGDVDYYGLIPCAGCCCCGNTGFTGPAHAFPNWNGSITGFNFKNIKLKDFFDICYDSTQTVSPNIGLTCTDCN